jgi:hypothetical protein
LDLIGYFFYPVGSQLTNVKQSPMMFLLGVLEIDKGPIRLDAHHFPLNHESWIQYLWFCLMRGSIVLSISIIISITVSLLVPVAIIVIVSSFVMMMLMMIIIIIPIIVMSRYWYRYMSPTIFTKTAKLISWRFVSHIIAIK